MVQLASKVGDAKKRKEVSVPLNDIIYDLSVDAFTSLGNSFYEFSMKRLEMLKSEAAKQRGKACDTVNVNVKCCSCLFFACRPGGQSSCRRTTIQMRCLWMSRPQIQLDPVANRVNAFESKLDSLASSMPKMSDSFFLRLFNSKWP